MTVDSELQWPIELKGRNNLRSLCLKGSVTCAKIRMGSCRSVLQCQINPCAAALGLLADPWELTQVLLLNLVYMIHRLHNLFTTMQNPVQEI